MGDDLSAPCVCAVAINLSVVSGDIAHFCRRLTIRHSDRYFIDLIHQQLERLYCKGLYRSEQLLEKLASFSEMPNLTQLSLSECTDGLRFSIMRCSSLVELCLFDCTLTEMPPSSDSAFPMLERLHIEEKEPEGLSAWKKEEYTEKEAAIKEGSRNSAVLANMPSLVQISGNALVSVMVEVNMPGGWQEATPNDSVQGYARKRLSRLGSLSAQKRFDLTELLLPSLQGVHA